MSFNTSRINYRTPCVSSRSPWLNSKFWTGAAFAGTSVVLGTDLTLLANSVQAGQLKQFINPSQTSGIEFLATSNPQISPSAFHPDKTLLDSKFSFSEHLIEGIQTQFTVRQTLHNQGKAAESELQEQAAPTRTIAKPETLQKPEFTSPSLDLLPDLSIETIAAEISQSAVSEASDKPADSQLSTGHSTAQLAETDTTASPKPTERVLKEGSLLLGQPYVRFQGVYVLQGDESSARARLTGLYPVRPNLLFGAEVDLTTGDAFSDSPGGGLSLNELYVAYSPKNLPNLRLVGGLMDLTSYFDRNSFAKDGTTHFFNRVFQTNPALSAAGIASRPGVLVNWSVTDNLELKAAGFSSRRDLSGFTLDSFASEIGVRFGTAIIRGTYVTSRDSGKKTGFEEIFDFRRDNGDFGLEPGDREEAYGINAEWYIPSLRVGLFGRYGHYNNRSLGRGADTFSVGLNVLDLFMPSDRFGIGYGRQLSNSDLRRDRGDKVPDVLETFYDFRILPNLRGAVTLQFRDQFSETIFGFRIKTEFDLVPFRRPFR